MTTPEEQAETIRMLQQQLADAQGQLAEREADLGLAGTSSARRQAPAAPAMQPQTDIEEVTNAPKLPPFWHKNPSLWFVQVEAQFHASRVRADLTKYCNIVAALDPTPSKPSRTFYGTRPHPTSTKP